MTDSIMKLADEYGRYKRGTFQSDGARARLHTEVCKLNHDLANERCANTLLQAAYDALEVRWNKLVEDKAK